MEKGNKTVMIIIIALLVILLAAVGVLSVFAINTLNKLQSGIQSGVAPTPKIVEKLEPSKLTEIKLDEKNINLKVGEDGKNHIAVIKVTINIDNSQKESEDFITIAQEKTGIFEDALLEVVRGYTIEELKAPEGLGILKEELLIAFQESFNNDLIYSVKIVGFTTQ